MSARDHTGRILDDKYALERLLGEGGMGAVYLARHTGIDRPVAVKFLHAGFARNEEAVKRFHREARTAASIGHRNIIDVLDVGTTPEGEPYLVMEYLEGESLSGMLARVARLDLPAASAVLEPVLRALAAAHEKGVVHRDLKPDNIFLVPRAGEVPEVKLIDFGVSKVESAPDRTKLTRDGSMLGTPAYMAPEQARGLADVDHRADLYSAGVILYEMLTGGLPFTGESFNDLLINALTTEPRPPAELFSGFPAEAGPLLDRALRKDPAERFQSAEEMIAALGALSCASDRQAQLTQLGSAIRQSGSAVGDLGASVEAPAPTFGGDRGEVARDPARRAVARYWPIAAALLGLVLLTVLARLLASRPEEERGVSITVKGAPKGARIYYDDYLVPMNPFKVEKRETIAPIRVEAPGYIKLKVSIVPSGDQVVEVRLVPLGRSGAAARPTDEDQADRQKRTKKSRNPFRDFKWPWQK